MAIQPREKPYHFCPVCGSQLAVAEHDGQNVPTCTNAACGFVFWQNAKPATVGVIANEDGNVLLTVRSIEPHLGKLDWPGGFCLENEIPEEGVRRELEEELGLTTEVVAPLGHALDRYGDSEYLVLSAGFVMRIVEGKLAINHELSAAQWIDPFNVNRSQLAFESTPYFLDAYLKYANN